MRIFSHIFVVQRDNEPLLGIDIIDPETNRSATHGQTLEEMQARYPGAYITTWEDYLNAHRAYFIKPPVVITKEEWYRALEILPPNRWVNQPGNSSFQMSEHLTDGITEIYAYTQGHYFKLANETWLNHDQIMEACQAALATGTANV